MRPRLFSRLSAAAMAAVVMISLVVPLAEPHDEASLDSTRMVASIDTSRQTAESTISAVTTPLEPIRVTDLEVAPNVSVAVLNTATGDSAIGGADLAYDTASIVKVDIVAALLWQNGGQLTAEQTRWASAAITYSDNASSTALFRAIGGSEGLDEFNSVIGLDDTVAGTNLAWGLTQTTVSDQITLLTLIFGDDTSVLDEDAKDLLSSLMSQVVPAQRFGVNVVADDATDVALKVGYLQRSASGLWDVTSIGQVTVNGESHLIAVLTGGQSSFTQAVAAIEDAVRTAEATLASQASSV